MTIRRRAGAPRLIDWTGERAVPWAPDVQVIYEHYHRYLWAQRLVTGLEVLDLGSGEGFGAALLSERAASVLGIDVDARTVEHARLNYSGASVRFEVGSATDLAGVPDASVDAVVAFEIIEHVEDQGRMLEEVKRVLRPGGLLVTSTPDKRAYTDATGQDNPFHVRELTEEQFRELLAGRFAHVTLHGQRAATGSKIEPLDDAPAAPALSLHLEQSGDGWREAGPMSPMYLIAVASDVELPPLPTDSMLADFDLRLMREAEERVTAATAAELEALRPAAHERDVIRDAHARAAESLAASLRHLESSSTGDLAADVDRLAALALELRDAAAAWPDERDGFIGEVTALAIKFNEALRQREAELEQAAADQEAVARRLRLVEESVAWKIFQRSRGKLYGAVGGKDSYRGRAIGATMRGVGRIGARRSQAVAGADGSPALEPREPLLTLPRFDAPDASIVIAAHSGAELTHRCLSAILHATEGIAYEVIVVDDAADEATKELLAAVGGIRVIVNEENLGYLRSVNRGSAAARGKYLVQLNNDTEPQPGWLEALVHRVESAEDVGIVVPRLLYPDGVLQEAGGIVWRDGSGWNYGRGDDATAARYAYVREVDYGSAAAMLVKADLWRELGGFDERYAPGYYEDTDLCFAARAHGLRVLYEPHATVIHVEGASMGTDVSTGGKAHQELNRVTFAEKWREALERQHPGPALERVSFAADRASGSQVLVFDHRVPTPDQDSGSLRMWHVMTNLMALGHRVTFVPDNFQAIQPYTRELQGLGVHVLYGDINLPALLAGMGATTRLAIVSRPYVAPRYVHLLRELLPHVPIAYDTVDLHYVRENRRAELEQNPDRTKALGLKELEIALARSSEVTLTVSEEEAERLRRDAPGVEVRVVPNANRIWRKVPGPDARTGLLFVGGFEHPPNTDAAVFLARRVMQHVWRRLPDMTLTIIGANAPPEVLRLSAPNVDVAGWVEDLEPVLRSSLALVAPLRYGAGVKGKVTQSLSAGLPVITTPTGAEGLYARDGEDVLLAEEAEAFADHVIRLHGEPELWRTLSTNGQEVIRRLGSPEVQRDALRKLLAEFEAGFRRD